MWRCGGGGDRLLANLVSDIAVALRHRCSRLLAAGADAAAAEAAVAASGDQFVDPDEWTAAAARQPPVVLSVTLPASDLCGGGSLR